MNHYAYLLEFPNNMKYMGAHSTTLEPELDVTYLGSGRALPIDRKDFPTLISKTILATFDTREELMAYEYDFLLKNDCCNSSDWYNKRMVTTDRFGCVPWNKGKNVNRDKAAETYSRRYKNHRTPAMIKAHAETADKIRGTKCEAKGRKGTDNQAFNPWYYITPEGDYAEVHNETVVDKAESLGWKYHQIVNRMRTNNAHKAAKTLPMKGWVFGVLPRPDAVLA